MTFPSLNDRCTTWDTGAVKTKDSVTVYPLHTVHWKRSTAAPLINSKDFVLDDFVLLQKYRSIFADKNFQYFLCLKWDLMCLLVSLTGVKSMFFCFLLNCFESLHQSVLYISPGSYKWTALQHFTSGIIMWPPVSHVTTSPLYMVLYTIYKRAQICHMHYSDMCNPLLFGASFCYAKCGLGPLQNVVLWVWLQVSSIHLGSLRMNVKSRSEETLRKSLSSCFHWL